MTERASGVSEFCISVSFVALYWPCLSAEVVSGKSVRISTSSRETGAWCRNPGRIFLALAKGKWSGTFGQSKSVRRCEVTCFSFIRIRTGIFKRRGLN